MVDYCFFCFKQKTAYEMRISDWSSDVCSSDLSRGEEIYTQGAQCNACHGPEGVGGVASHTILDSDNEFVAQVNWTAPALDTVQIGRASGRERVCQYV